MGINDYCFSGKLMLMNRYIGSVTSKARSKYGKFLLFYYIVIRVSLQTVMFRHSNMKKLVASS